ncbi:MAG: hypothetical protein WCY49_06050 [Anaerovoracaceae bacterium]|jgi:hypothetical protein
MPTIYTLTDKEKTVLIVRLDTGEEAVCPVCGEKDLDESTKFEEPDSYLTYENKYFVCKHSFLSICSDLNIDNHIVLPLKYKDPEERQNELIMISGEVQNDKE